MQSLDPADHQFQAQETIRPLPNPNALLGHDPRSWHRGGLWTPRGRAHLKNSHADDGGHAPSLPEGMDVRHFNAADLYAATDMSDLQKFGWIKGGSVEAIESSTL